MSKEEWAALQAGNGDGATEYSGSAKGKPGGVGKGDGGGRGDGHEKGTGEGQTGWYKEMLKDRFTARWDQPVSLVQDGKKFVTSFLIKIDRSGRIAGFRLTKSSGNATMDESAVTAVQLVKQVDPVPKELGDANGCEFPFDFVMNP